MSNTEKKKSLSEDNIADELSKLECPFNWKMDELDSKTFTDYTPHDEEDLVPLLKLMRVIMKVYVETKENESQDKIMEDLAECDVIMKQLRKENNPQFSLPAIQYVLDSTRCHVTAKFKSTEAARKIVDQLNAVELSRKHDESTIYGCRSIGWSKYHKLCSEEAIDWIRKALKYDPDCDLWNFILGKNLRRLRRDVSVGSIPGDEEKKAFLKAYEKTKNCTYGIFVAQMYIESRNEAKAALLYEEIFNSRPNINTVYLRLALGFIRLFKLPQAKKCLDAVTAPHNDDSVYHHYLGKYYTKVRNYGLASCHLKKAAKGGNYPASRDYVRCMMRLNRTYDPLEYLLEVMQGGIRDQRLYMDLALTYLKEQNYEMAIKYFHAGVQIDPNNKFLLEYYSFYNPGKSDNIYRIILKEIVSRKNSGSLSEESRRLVGELEKFYNDYMDSQTDFMGNILTKVRTY